MIIFHEIPLCPVCKLLCLRSGSKLIDNECLLRASEACLGHCVASFKQCKKVYPLDMLHRFQLQWNDLHELLEQNAGKAQEADTLVSSIYEKLQHEWNSVTCLNSTLAYIPKINNAIQDLMDQIGNLQEMFEEVEGALYRLEDLNEMLDLQNRQLEHRFQLAMYKEKKLLELNNFKAKLADEHIERISQHELKEQKKLKERRETFDEVFREDLEEYKATGSIPKLPLSSQGPSLDEIVLDVDTKVFDEFLEN